MKSVPTFIDLTKQVLSLIQLGLIVGKSSEPVSIDFHPSKFSSFPIHSRMLNDKVSTKRALTMCASERQRLHAQRTLANIHELNVFVWKFLSLALAI